MQQKLNVIVLSIDHWLSGLVYSAAALSRAGCEIFWVNPGRLEDEIAALKLLAARLPVTLTDGTGDPAFGDALRGVPELAALPANQSLPAGIDPELLTERFGPVRGIVTASQNDPSRCLKAAVLAVRLGYIFLPAEILAASPQLPEGLPLIRLGLESKGNAAGCARASGRFQISPMLRRWSLSCSNRSRRRTTCCCITLTISMSGPLFLSRWGISGSGG